MTKKELHIYLMKEIMNTFSLIPKKARQKEIAKILGISQPRVSELSRPEEFHYKFSIDKLLSFMETLNIQTSMTVSKVNARKQVKRQIEELRSEKALIR
ncbi:XRE family transcriptional regulator [Vibrio sp. Vb1980]|uniref:XRE family transcriptional regulator n=1 Tax=Vibrio sp. Vb1980 TaxID=3074646 RepID=UPI002964FA49|nr:XRE family transcriptional regulator [Vibrio sp. Vb1980]MDW1975690.1 XRE family transcriptional regulator [Vibrio sp. Vb1980]